MINIKASVCKNHITVVAAGGGAGLILSSLYIQEHQINRVEIEKGKRNTQNTKVFFLKLLAV